MAIGINWAEIWADSIWSSIWAQALVVGGSMTVTAYRRGFYGGLVVEVGQTLTLTTPYQYTPYWMTISGSVPTGWEPYLEVYSQPIDDAINRPLTTADILAILARRPH